MLDRPPRPSRARRMVTPATVMAVIVALTLALPGVAGAVKKRRTVITMIPGELTVYGVGNDPQALPDAVRDQVMATLDAYVKAATVKPLRKGVVNDTALAATLAATATARATGPDRSVLVDEGLPKAVGRIVVKALPVQLTGLADADGNVVAVTAHLDAKTRTKTAKGKLEINRNGDVVLMPEGDAWKIDGYDLVVDRIGKGVGRTTATTAPAGPAPTR